eukprot:TRINITY_DN3378_c0_g1_i1.p1 TRINITY_DN3378_c0_g1~~TRINITY_DN3378_c0_g1_i1.p1  ORF type:complete len:1079 (+),score=355.40 TRINITY_DN3378_c0_g1_i1:86-3238(+)
MAAGPGLSPPPKWVAFLRSVEGAAGAEQPLSPAAAAAEAAPPKAAPALPPPYRQREPAPPDGPGWGARPPPAPALRGGGALLGIGPHCTAAPQPPPPQRAERESPTGERRGVQQRGVSPHRPPPRHPAAAPAAAPAPAALAPGAQSPPAPSPRKAPRARTRHGEVIAPADEFFCPPEAERLMRIVVGEGEHVGMEVTPDRIVCFVARGGAAARCSGDSLIGMRVVSANGRPCEDAEEVRRSVRDGGWAEALGEVTLGLSTAATAGEVRRAAATVVLDPAAVPSGMAVTELFAPFGGAQDVQMRAVADPEGGPPALLAFAALGSPSAAAEALSRSPIAGVPLYPATEQGRQAAAAAALQRSLAASAAEPGPPAPPAWPAPTVTPPPPAVAGLELTPSGAGVGAALAALACGAHTAAAAAPPREEEGPTGHVRLLLEAYDTNHDGALDYQEYCAMCNELERTVPQSETAFEELCRHLGERHGCLTLQSLSKVANVATPDAEARTGMQRNASLRLCAKTTRKTSGVVPGPGKHAAFALGLSSLKTVDLPAVAARLQRLWENKKGDVLDELCANLTFPPRTKGFRIVLLAQAARTVAERAGLLSEGEAAVWMSQRRNLMDILVMALYTMAGPDVDATLSFLGVPDFERDGPKRWERYRRRHPWRNTALFSVVNWAMRGAGERPAGKTISWDSVERWVKTITLLTALASKPAPSLSAPSESIPPLLFRGLAGLPVTVARSYQMLRPGDEVNWTAPSSCATSRGPAETYLRGAAANAQKGTGGRVMFTIHGCGVGLELAEVSRYPREQEVLLPPFSRFTVLDVAVERATEEEAELDEGLPAGTVSVGLRFEGLGAPELAKLLRRSAEDAEEAAARLLGRHPESEEPEWMTEVQPQLHTMTQAPGERWPANVITFNDAELITTTQEALRKEFGSLRGAWSRMNIKAVQGRKDGVIDHEELSWGLMQVGLQNYAKDLIRLLDRNNDGELAFQEFAALTTTAKRWRRSSRPNLPRTATMSSAAGMPRFATGASAQSRGSGSSRGTSPRHRNAPSPRSPG